MKRSYRDGPAVVPAHSVIATVQCPVKALQSHSASGTMDGVAPRVSATDAPSRGKEAIVVPEVRGHCTVLPAHSVAFFP